MRRTLRGKTGRVSWRDGQRYVLQIDSIVSGWGDIAGERKSRVDVDSRLSSAMAPPPTPARLASLSSTLLSQILELTRSSQLSLPAPTLTASILKNLAALRAGIEHLQGGGLTGAVLDGLHEQEERLVGLVEGLGVAVPGRKGKEGRLVDVGDEEEPDEWVHHPCRFS